MGVKTDARFTQAGLRLFSALVLSVCATVVLTLPTPALPTELPALVVSTRVDDALLTRDLGRAHAAPDDADTRALRQLVEDAGRREGHALADGIDVEEEQRRALALRRRITRAHGTRAIARLRSKSVVAFTSRFDPTRAVGRDELGVVGGFRKALVSWNAIVDDRLVAPSLVVRVLYAARWNVICRLPPTSGFGRQELRTYHGWFGLHAEHAPVQRRLDALQSYRMNGDEFDRSTALVATATLLVRSNDFMTASRLFAAASESNPGPRLRNFAHAAAIRAE